MATLSIFTFPASSLADLPLVQLPPRQSITIANVDGTSKQSTALSSETRVAMVVGDVDMVIEVGSNPTAAAGSVPIYGGKPFYFMYEGSPKIAAITV